MTGKKQQTEGKTEEEMRQSETWQRKGVKDGVMNRTVCLRTDRPALACLAKAEPTG